MFECVSGGYLPPWPAPSSYPLQVLLYNPRWEKEESFDAGLVPLSTSKVSIKQMDDCFGLTPGHFFIWDGVGDRGKGEEWVKLHELQVWDKEKKEKIKEWCSQLPVSAVHLRWLMARGCDGQRQRERLLFTKITSRKGREQWGVKTSVFAPYAPARKPHTSWSGKASCIQV